MRERIHVRPSRTSSPTRKRSRGEKRFAARRSITGELEHLRASEYAASEIPTSAKRVNSPLALIQYGSIVEGALVENREILRGDFIRAPLDSRPLTFRRNDGNRSRAVSETGRKASVNFDRW